MAEETLLAFSRVNLISIRKSIAQIRVEARSQALAASLGPMHLLLLGVGSIIGAGIYVMTGLVAAAAGGRRTRIGGH